jgi:small subunit ribosomal protein S16
LADALKRRRVHSTPTAKELDIEIMAVRIRLKRIGAKNTPAYRIVVTDSRSPRDGRFIEEIGSYLPSQRENNVKLSLERAQYWLGKGAQPSETVASMIKKATKAAAAVVA